MTDAYELFLLGPSFLKNRSREIELLPTKTFEGRTYDVLRMRLVPGLGQSAADMAEAWIDRENKRLFRVFFTLEGFEDTRGATVDTTFHNHREIGGFLWPTRFVERVRSPVRIFAHEWFVTGLDFDRPAVEQVVNGPEEILGFDKSPAQSLGTDTPARQATSS